MKTIVAATDFTPVSLNAVNYAADMASMLSARLTLFHVFATPIPVGDVPAKAYNIEEMATEAEKQTDQLKEQLLRRTGERIIIHNEVRSGYMLSELIDYCITAKPFAVVMGTETTDAFERFLVGGKTVSAISQLPWPLVVIPPQATFKNIRKIGLACDLRNVVESVRVREIMDLVDEFNAELHVLHVSAEAGEAFSPESVMQSGLLQEMIGALNPQYHFINETDIEKGIIEFAEKNNLDLLVIIPKKHGLLSGLFHHSHSKDLIMHVQVPVMSIHE